MIPYTVLATTYDYLLKHVDYTSWYLYISSLMIRYIDNPRTVLELGCGTGKFGAKFSADHFTIYGIDNSLEMLQVASVRAFNNFRVVCADMTNFSLSKKIDFIFSVHDTLNYFLKYSDIRKVFKSVRNTMHDLSIFMFDITTEHNIIKHFEGVTSKYRRRNIEIEWSNTFDRKNRLVHSYLFFKNDDGSVNNEEHVQRIYSIDEIKELLRMEKFEILDIFGDYSMEPPVDDTVMINFIVRKS